MEKTSANNKIGESNYVLGFLISMDRTKVILVKKSKPHWQKGKLNGIGGKVEDGESFEDAMKREFFEETQVAFNEWVACGMVSGPNYQVKVFRGFIPFNFTVKGFPDEPVAMYSLEHVLDDLAHPRRKEGFVTSLGYILPTVLNDNVIRFETLHQK